MKTIDLGLGGGSLLQIANREHTQSMSYMIKSDTGKIVIIDYANYKRPEDAENLYSLLKENGSHVDAWFITHAHSDHIGGLAYIWEKYGNEIQIDKIVYDFPDYEWLCKVNGKHDMSCIDLFEKYVKEYSIQVIKPEKDMVFNFGVRIEVLNSLLDNYKNFDDVNDSGICLKAHFKNNSVLFLGDMGKKPEDDLIEIIGDKLRCDIVQMAHHGQNGVTQKTYKRIMPKVCLWCTPDWLWDNDNGGGIGSGGWKTLETRAWMEELGVKKHYVAKDGDFLFI